MLVKLSVEVYIPEQGYIYIFSQQAQCVHLLMAWSGWMKHITYRLEH